MLTVAKRREILSSAKVGTVSPKTARDAILAVKKALEPANVGHASDHSSTHRDRAVDPLPRGK